MSELSEVINEMRTMREAYDELSAAAEAYNTGKTELAQNINAKGVEASASESLPQLAEKVAAITQESYTIDGGEMYAKQLFGSLETPNYWNLYDILAQLLSDGRLVQYGGILLAEYYRGYDSLALSGAGAGGAYVVSDLDEQGNFKMYTEDTTHIWATEFDGKGNRWVAYCFADEYHDFQITNTNTSPRSIFIGRKVGTITALVNTRISQIVVPDGNELRDFNPSTFTNPFGKKTIICNLSKSSYLYPTGTYDAFYISVKGDIQSKSYSMNINVNSFIAKATRLIVNSRESGILASMGVGDLSTAIVEADEITGINDETAAVFWSGAYVSGLKEVILRAERIYNVTPFHPNSNNRGLAPKLKKVFLGYITNDKTRSVNINPYYAQNAWYYEIIELQQGWCKPLVISYYTQLTENSIYTYILQRLKQDEPNCGSGVTITLGSTNLAKLTSDESQALLAELRGTYGYTFA